MAHENALIISSVIVVLQRSECPSFNGSSKFSDMVVRKLKIGYRNSNNQTILKSKITRHTRRSTFDIYENSTSMLYHHTILMISSGCGYGIG